MAEKNLIIALVLSLIITGAGLIYDGLTTRGLVSFAIALLLGLISAFVSSIFMYISIIWGLYVLYDTYLCTNAINNNQTIPKFLTQLDLE